MSRILTATAMYLNKTPPNGFVFDIPPPYVRGKYFYIWVDEVLQKYRFLGYCVNQYAFRIATLKHDSFTPVENGE